MAQANAPSGGGASPIDKIVLLTLENRSLDHMLGLLPRTGHLSGFEGLSGTEFNLLDPQDPQSERFEVQPGAIDEFYGHSPADGPAHSFNAANVQLTGSTDGPDAQHPAAANGFVKSFAATLWTALNKGGSGGNKEPTREQIALVMQAFRPEQVPVISTLAQEFVVCDRWFSSVPGPTMPNRLYMHAATSAGFAYNEWSHRFDFRTIYNSLQDAGRSWRVYYSNDNVATNFTQVPQNADQMRRFEDHFTADCAAGDLANFSFIVPRFISWDGGSGGVQAANSEHAPGSVAMGEALIATVYNAMRANPKVWESCLLIVLYDEHGGFYDHVVPPAGVPNPDGLTSPQPGQKSWAPSFDFTRLGFRVPAILASPWLAPQVLSTQLEHASVPATLKRFYGLGDYLTARDRAANSFEQLLTGAGVMREDCPERLTPPDAPGHAGDRHKRPLDEIQTDIVRGAVARLRDPGERQAALAKVDAGLTEHEAHGLVQQVLEKHFQDCGTCGGKHWAAPG